MANRVTVADLAERMDALVGAHAEERGRLRQETVESEERLRRELAELRQGLSDLVPLVRAMAARSGAADGEAAAATAETSTLPRTSPRHAADAVDAPVARDATTPLRGDAPARLVLRAGRRRESSVATY